MNPNSIFSFKQAYPRLKNLLLQQPGALDNGEYQEKADGSGAPLLTSIPDIDLNLVPSQMTGPIFIGGTGRSGTTILARLLGEHPNIFMLRWETQLIVAEGGLIRFLDDFDSDKANSLFSRKLKGEWFRRILFAGEPNEYQAGLCADIPWEDIQHALDDLLSHRMDSNVTAPKPLLGRAFINAIFEPSAIRRNARRWGEKTPRNIVFIKELWQMFPNMRFLHIIRDGRDVVASMLQNGFWPIAPSPYHPETANFKGMVNFELATDYWVTMLDIARQSAAFVPRENYMEIRLEDLVSQPPLIIRRIMEFLNEDIDPALLSFNLSRSNANRWRQDLTPRQIAYFQDHAGFVLQREGYDLA
jgi:hypothetical protein